MAQSDSVVWGTEYGAQIPNTGSQTAPLIMFTFETQCREILCHTCGTECHYFTERIHTFEGSQVWGTI